MANKIKLKRGLSTNINSLELEAGELAITTDTSELYAGDKNNNAVKINNNTTYALSKNGSSIILTGSDGSTTSVTDSNTTYNAATTSANGLMSSSDKTKLDGIATGATKNTASSTTPKANGTATVGSEANYARGDHVHPAQTAVSGNAGTATKFASAQSVALTGDVTGSASSQAGWSVATTLANSGVTAGSYGPTANVTGTNGTTINVPQITVDAKGRVTSIVNRTYTSKDTDTNTTYSAATTSANGLMSSSDKTKLNGIATGAQVNNVVVSTSQPTASTAEVWVNPSGALDLSALWDKLYPVGSVYMSTSSTNPGTLFGGTWAQITGKFLYCSTTSKTTGGSETHTHTGPSHSHTYGIALGAFYGAAGYESSGYTGVLQNGTGDPAGWASWTSANVTNNSSATQTSKTNNNAIQKSTANTGASGTGTTGASSSLPPYFTVYCWYRTA